MATSKFVLPPVKKENVKMSFKDLVGKKMTKPTKFMGEDVKISKLSVAEVMEIQARAKELEGGADNDGFSVLKVVIRSAVEGASEISDEDFNAFPMDELAKLSAEIMKFSGIGQEAGK